MSAEDLGKRLLPEIEEVGLDEILNVLRMNVHPNGDLLGLPQLDKILTSITEAGTAVSSTQPTIPIVELVSLLPGAGKTHLIYHLTAISVLPTYLGGKQKAVVLLDADGKFSVLRLFQQIKNVASSFFIVDNDKTSLEDVVLTSLKHVHIFRPQSLASTIATLQSLRNYLFDSSRHHSFDRAIGFIALDSASTFYWQNKAEIEDTALTPSTSIIKPLPQPNGYVQLAAALKTSSRVFNAPILFTTTHLGPLKGTTGFGPESRSFRPSLSPPWPSLPSLRLIVGRVAVRKLPVEIDVEEAGRESELRQKVVAQGKFQCFVNAWGMEEKILQKLQKAGSGFDFTITESGCSIDQG